MYDPTSCQKVGKFILPYALFLVIKLSNIKTKKNLMWKLKVNERERLIFVGAIIFGELLSESTYQKSLL